MKTEGILCVPTYLREKSCGNKKLKFHAIND